MNIFRRFYCRTYQTIFKLLIPFLPYRKPKIKNSLFDIKEIILENKKSNPLIITDNVIYSQGLLDNLLNDLKENSIKFNLFNEVLPNPTSSSIEALYKKIENLKIDCLIAIGGGSVIDFAKGLGIKLVKPNKDLNRFKGVLKVRKKLPLFIACPTTCGTGSEVTVTTVITDDVKEYKFTINDFSLIPNYAILDSNLLKKLPSHLVATTGMDALTHAVEAYIGRSRTKETKKSSVDAVRLIYENIENAALLNDLNAKNKMLYASYYAGIAFRKSYVGYVHALAHAIGGKYHLAHGYTNAIILPIMLELYGKSCYKKVADLARKAGIVDKNISDIDSYKIFIDWIKKLNSKFNLPKRIKEINESDLDSISSFADKEANPLYPVPLLMNEKELKKALSKIMYRKNSVDNIYDIIGKEIKVVVDRPIGYNHKGIIYPINYGYTPGIFADDNEEQDVYILDEIHPLKEYKGKVIAIVHRLDDDEDKWVVSKKDYSIEEIKEILDFQEKYFDSVILK